MHYFEQFFSPIIITAVIFGMLNYSLLKLIKHPKILHFSRNNLFAITIFILMKAPENFGWIQSSASFFVFYKMIYSAILIFFVARTLIHFMVNVLLTKKLKAPKIFYDISKGVFYFIAIMFLLKENGVSINSIFTTSAILTAVVGLALQNTLNDIVAGLIINTEKTLKAGDWIRYDDKIGQLSQFSWRYVEMITLENEHLIIPNKEMTANTIQVYSGNNFRHFMKVPFGVTYDNIPNHVIDVVRETVKDIPGISQPDIFFVEYGDFAIMFNIRFFLIDVNRYFSIKSDILTKVFYAFSRHDIEIPIPRYDLFMREYGLPTPEATLQENDHFLKTIDFLGPLSKKERTSVAASIKMVRYAQGEFILKQDQPNDTFFYIQSGIVDVLVNQNHVATLSEKQFFGEISLMTGETTTAAIMAKTDTTVYKLQSNVFHQIFKKNQELIDAISEVITSRKLQNLELSQNISAKKKRKMEQKLKIERAKLSDRIRQFFSI